MIRPLSYLNLCACITCLKLLFLRSYVSTDFDVHRNWMAITYNLPIKQWYFDTLSEWTLDYPPLFAAFEFLLAIVAHLLNLETTLKLSETGIRDESTIIYQKTSVIISDIIYYYAIYKLCQSLSSKSEGQSLTDSICRPDKESGIALLLLLQPGLLMVDHIHFQYNGLLSGVLLLAIASLVQGKYISGSFWFATLLNMKHIYLYCAPAFGLYILTSYCFEKKFFERIFQLGMTVLLVFSIALAPFADLDTLKQILARLFPFKRGLTHAYWAPNIWSLYNGADKVLSTIFRRSLQARFDLDTISSTSGLVQGYKHQYLPTVTPLMTLIVVAVFTLPLVIKFLANIGRKSPDLFMRGLVVASFTAFMFGWHVHEKAIIVVLLPLIPVAFRDPNLSSVLLRLTLLGTYSLFPLLYQPAEYLVKTTLLISYYSYAKSISSTKANTIYILGIIAIEIYNTSLHERYHAKYEFLPLLLTSTFSAVGISISYLETYLDFIKF